MKHLDQRTDACALAALALQVFGKEELSRFLKTWLPGVLAHNTGSDNEADVPVASAAWEREADSKPIEVATMFGH